jgi:lipopolysaccharide export system permease protein
VLAGKCRMIPNLDRYILRQVLKPLMATMSIGLIVLLAERMVGLLDTTLGKKNSFAIVFEMLAYLAPHYLGLAVPAALFLGMLLGFNKMSKDNEIEAWMASGISLGRLARPALALGFLLSLLSLLVFGWIQPYTRYAYRSVVFNVKNVDVFYLAEEGVFMQAGNRTFIIDKLNRSNNSFDRIFLFEDKGKDGVETVTATRGLLLEQGERQRPVLRLENGRLLDIGKWPASGGAELAKPASATFATTDTPLGRIATTAFRPRGEDERELTLPELYENLNTPPKQSSQSAMLSQLHKRLVSILVPMMLPILAIPFALGSRRSPRAYRIGVALIILIAFHEIIEQGDLATSTKGFSPWITMWLPFGLLALFAAWRFWIQAYTLKPDRLDVWADSIGDMTASWRLAFRRAFGGADQ